jgi:hypothetical protein
MFDRNSASENMHNMSSTITGESGSWRGHGDVVVNGGSGAGGSMGCKL